MKLTTIEIDWDIHQKIEIERQGFHEAPFHALRRLLGLPSLSSIQNEAATPVLECTGRPWFEEGVEVPHGSLARMRYNHGRQTYEGEFLDDNLLVNGKPYKTLSAAASDLAVTKYGKKTQINGWLYWEVKFPGADVWCRLEDLRKAVKQITAE